MRSGEGFLLVSAIVILPHRISLILFTSKISIFPGRTG